MKPFKLRDFRLLWTGEAISGLGDQFATIALPWLALVLTGSGLALGSVLALMAIPRAALMVVGGAYVDRLSPRRVMLVSNAVRFVAVGTLGVIVLSGSMQLWMLYAFALVFGIADAFFYPAVSAVVPALVPGEQLGQANAIVQGTGQLTIFVGPALAGVIIALFGSTAGTPSTEGIGIALVFDAFTFLASIATLWFIRSGAAKAAEVAESIVSQIREGIAFVWNWPSMRLIVLMSMAANFLIVGPFEVGMPAIAYERLPEGAIALGLMTSGFGLGSLVGLAAAAMMPAPRKALFASFALVPIALAGLLTAVMSQVFATLPAVAVTFGIGICLGFGNLLAITWVQRRVPGALMGRVMSLLMIGSTGLVPVSMFIAGFIVEINLSGLFIVGGLGMSVLALISLLVPAIRNMGFEPVVDEQGSGAPEETSGAAPVAA
jgi:MFS family permease